MKNLWAIRGNYMLNKNQDGRGKMEEVRWKREDVIPP